MRQSELIKIQVYTFSFFCALCSVSAISAPQIGLSLDQQVYETDGKTPTIKVAVFNDVKADYDIHVGVISPEGVIYEYPTWKMDLDPWLENFTLPADFHFPLTAITNLDSLPKGLTPGIWQAVAAFTEPGTLNFSAFASAPFNVTDPENKGISAFYSLSIRIAQFPSGTSVSASGAFFSANLPLKDLINFVETKEPNINQCIFQSIDINKHSRINTQKVDAGTVTISSAEQFITLDKTQSLNGPFYHKDDLPLSFYKSNVNYTIEGSGDADLPAFSATLTSIPPLLVITPSLAESKIDTTRDYNLEWKGNNGIGEIRAMLFSRSEENFNFLKIISCRFSDDSHGVIPSNLMAQLKNESGFDAELIMSREVSTLFSVTGSSLELAKFSITTEASRGAAFFTLE